MNRSKTLAIILTITMCLAMLPTGAYAEDPPASGEGTGTLTISSSPAGADVYIDDVLRTVVTPAELDLAPGTYNLKLSIPGYEDFNDTVVIQEGQTTVVNGVVQLPDLVEPAAENVITVNSGGDSTPNSSVTVEQVKAQGTITLRDAVTAIMNESESTGHFRIEFAEGVSEIAINSCLNINHRGNLTINGDRDRDGTADVNIDHGPGFLDWLGAINAIASDTYLVGLRFDGSDNSGKATFLSLRVPDEHGPADTYNIENLYVLGCEFINNYDVGVATCGAYGYSADGYGAAGTANFSNLVFAGNTFNKTGVFSFAGAGDEDYNVIDGYKIVANQFVNGGIGMLAGDAHTWYVYGQDSAQGNGGVPGQIGYCENNILRNVLISGNNIELNDQAGEEYTSIIQVSGANLGNSGNLVDTITIRNNTSKVLDPEGRNVFATLALGNVSIGDGGNLPNYAAPEFIHQTSDNMVKDVTMQYNDFQLGNGRGFLVYNVTTDVNNQEGSGNLFQNILIDNNRFDSANGATIANYMDKSQCGPCSDNNTDGIYFTNNTVTTAADGGGDRTGIVAANAKLTNLFGSPLTDMPEYSGTMTNVVIDGNTVTGNYQYGIAASGSAGDYADGMGIEGLSVSGNNINLINTEVRFGIVAAGGAMGTNGGQDGAPCQPGSTNCFLKNVTISDNIITSEGGIAVCGDFYESAPRDISIAGNHVDTITVQDNIIVKQDPAAPSKDLPGILVAGIADIWDRLSRAIPMPTLGGNRVIGATIGPNTITGFDSGKDILDLTAVNSIYPVNSTVTGEAILNELKALTDSAYGENSYEWTWSGTAYDSSTAGSYMAKGSRQTGMGIETMYYEAVVDPDAYDNTEGTVTVTTEAQFLTALDDPAVTHIIAKWVVVNIQQGTVLTKDLTLADSSNLNIIDNGLLIVATGATLTLDGNTAIQQNGELRIGGTLVNNATLTVSGVISALAPAAIENNGPIQLTDDPERGFGRISLIDIISDTGANPEDYVVSSVAVTGSNTAINGNISWTADVNGPNSLDYAMGNQTYTGIWLSEFQDQKDEVTGEVTGVSIIYDGDLMITKPIDIFENDSLTVTGDLTVSGPQGELYMDGTLTTLGGLTNDSFLYIGGTLTAGGAATNNGYYIQAAEATVKGTILDAGEGDHMKGYYVTDQAGWNAALADSTHCNPIIIAPEAAIAVNTDTTITSNLIVQGNLTVNEGVMFTLDMRFDNDIYGVMNNLSGTLINNGTLNLNMPLDICGTFENYGNINMAGYDGNEYGENWTTDGHIFLYTELNDEGAADDQSGLFTNYGSIFNENTISVNHDSNMVNADTGVIDNYGRIESWDGINETNLFPLTNTGVIWGGEINLDYEGFFFTWTEWRELQDVGGYPAVAKDDRGSLYRGATVFPAIGEETYALYYHYYDEVKGEWVDEPIDANDEGLSVYGVNNSSPDDVSLEEWADMSPEDIALIVDSDFTDYKFTKFYFSAFDYYMLSYNAGTAESPRLYYLPISVQLPELGYYRDASTDTADMENNYIKTFDDLSYVPNSPREERTFYAILNIHPDKFPEGYTTEYILYEGGDRVTVEPTYDETGETPSGDKRVFKVTIEDDVYGGFPLLMQVVVRNSEGEEMLRSEERFLWIDEQEAEGLVYSWPNDWRRYSQEGMEFDYPILSGGQNYETRAYVSLGNPTLALFHKYMGNDGWTYEPVQATDVTVIGQDPEMIAEDWAVANGIPENVKITDKEYANYKFTQIRCSKLGDYAISYTVGEGGETRTLTLPLTVMLPEVGFYSGASIDTQEMEANYIEEFAYTPTERTFYAILKTPEGYSVNWTVCNDSRVTVEQVPDSPVYSISVNENADQGFHVNFRAEFQNINNPEDKFTSDRWIWVYEGEYEGLVYRNLDWDGGAGGHFENMDWGFKTRLYADPREHVGIFYTKEYSQEENNGAGGWIYTPADVRLDNEDMTIMPLEPGRIYSGDDRNTINAPFYRSILFKGLGSYILEYTKDEKTFSLPLDVELPGLGAYLSTAIGMDTWLAEVDFARYRELYLIPFGEDMTDADLANSEFLVNSQPLTYDANDDVFLLEDGAGGAYLRVEPYREGGLIKHFTVTVLFTPFEQDFDLEYRIRDSEDNEFIYNQLHFYAPIDEAVSVVGSGLLATPTPVGDTGVTVEALGFNSVKYYGFTAGSLTADQAYLFKLAGAGESGSDKAKIFLFDESWSLLTESNWEDLREEGRAASIGTAALEPGKTYYVAVYNGANDPCGFQLTASVKTVPAMPTVEKFFDEALGVSQFKVSGATDGQMYEIYAKIGDQWHHRGTQGFSTESDYQFWNAFDVINQGETVTAVGVTINNGGIQGERAELLISMERTDSDGVPMDVEVLHYPESDELMVTAVSGGVFESGVYYRLRHERPDGFWDFHSSFIGNGTNTVLCRCDGELENAADQYATSDGKYIVAAYSESDSAGILRLGWNYHVNIERTGEASTGIGSFDYDRPTTWLAIGEEDFNQDFQGHRILGHSLSDGRTKFRLVTYHPDASGEDPKYTFSQPLNASELTTSAGLILTDLSGEDAEFVKFSFAAMGEYIVTYTDDTGTHKAILSANSPAPDDVFECIIDGATGTADVNVNIQSLRGREGEALNVVYALYEDGRMVGIATRSLVLRLNGFDDRVTIGFDPTAGPDTCKVFILNQGSYGPAMLNLIKGLSQ